MNELLRNMLRAFLREDLHAGDITSEALVEPGAQAAARVVARQAGVLAGIREARELGALAGLEAAAQVSDGDAVSAGQVVMRVSGALRGLLGVERTLLNLMSHMSGVATATRQAVLAVAGTGARIAATRKTLPGLRLLQKRAVVLGGGDPHRYDLGAAVLIKDNHLAAVGDVATAVTRARAAASFTAKVEIEVESGADAVAAAAAGADIVMLDNMTPEDVRQAIAALQRAGLRDAVVIEASGGITAATARAYAQAGAELISIGGLTASASALDLAFEIDPV